MAIDLPVPSAGASRRLRAVGLPDSSDVRPTPAPRDPGVAVPQGAFDGVTGIGDTLSGIADKFVAIQERQQKRRDATVTTETMLSFESEAREEFRRRQLEDDPSRPDFMQDYQKWIGVRRNDGGGFDVSGKVESALASLPEGTSADAKERLRLRLLESSVGLVDSAGLLQIKAEKTAADDAYTKLINTYSAQAMGNPEALQGLIGLADESVREFEGVWSPDRERDAKADARQALITSAVDGHLEKNQFDDARAILANEDHKDDLTPSARDRAGKAIETAEKAYKREIERKERERVAELRGNVSDAVVVLEAGKTPPLLDSLREQVKGTKLEDPLREAEEDADAMASFNAAPLPEQRAAIRDMQAQDTASARDVRLSDRMARAYTGHVRAVKADPIGYGAELGLYDLAEIDLNDPSTLKARQRQARLASEHFGVKVPAFRPAEITALKESVDDMSPDQAASMFRSLYQGLGEETAIETAGQIAGDDPALGVAVASSIDSPLLSAEIVRGQRLLKENKPEIPAVQMRAEIATVYGDMFSDVPGTLDSYVETAKAIYAARRVPGGDLAFDVGTFKTALQLAAGGAVLPDGSVTGGPLEFNNKTIIPPVAGMGEDEFRDLVEGLDIGAMTRFGNGAPQYGDGKPFDTGLFDTGVFGAKEAQFVTVGVGRYRVLLPGIGYIQNEAGDLYEIDLRRMATEAVPPRNMK